MKAGNAEFTGNITVLPLRSSKCTWRQGSNCIYVLFPSQTLMNTLYKFTIEIEDWGKGVPGELPWLTAEVSWGVGRRWSSFQPRGLKRGLEDSGVKFLSESAYNEIGEWRLRFLNLLREGQKKGKRQFRLLPDNVILVEKWENAHIRPGVLIGIVVK